MSTLIVPLCGKSTRFPNMRPKWMLTHPNGDFMVVEAIKGLCQSFFDKVYLVCLCEHEKQFQFMKGLEENLYDCDIINVEIIFLDIPTSSQPDTIYQAIKSKNIQGQIVIKDCDNYFSIPDAKGNFVCYSSLTDFNEINPNNKSYVKLSKEEIVENIVEKQIISTTFCCGGYAFEKAEEFAKTFEKLNLLQKDMYISDIVYDMLLEGKTFKGIKANDYVDFGTLDDWNRYKSTFFTLFLDIDGVLVKNSSQYLSPYIGESEPLNENIDFIKRLDSNKVYIILTTSRPEKSRKKTERQLKSLGIHYNNLIMELPHAKRIIVNDWSKTNPYPSCVAINILRDTDNLKDYFDEKIT